MSRDPRHARMREHDVLARRNVYPLVSSLPMYRGLSSATLDNLPIATRLANQLICLPLYPAMTDENVGRVVACVSQVEPCTLPS